MDDQVLIVGRGLAGLSLAIALAQRGLRPVTIERSQRAASGGTGLYLIGAAMRALGSLGVGAAVERAGALSATQKFFTHRGRLMAEVDAAEFWRPCGECLGIARSTLQQILQQQTTGLTSKLGTALVSLEQHEESVTVLCSDGSSARYGLVVGADGIRSTVARSIFGARDPRFRGQLAWRFLAPRPAEIDGWTVYMATGRAFLTLPISESQVYCYADRSANQRLPDEPEQRLERLRATFHDFAEPVGTLLSSVEAPNEVHYGAIEDVEMGRWSLGRTLLIGDAAHAMSPNMACGAALAFEDALVLAELIAEMGATPEVFPYFERRRADRVQWVRKQTDRRDRLRGLPTPLRNAFMRFAATRTYAANYGPLLATP